MNGTQDVIQAETVESKFELKDVMPDLPSPEDTTDAADARLALAHANAVAYSDFTKSLMLNRARFHEYEAAQAQADAAAMRAHVNASNDPAVTE